MRFAPRTIWLAVACLFELSPASTLNAGLCPQHEWILSEIADAPVLLVARVVSLDMENGPHFTGDPRSPALEQKMTAEVKVLRFLQRPTTAETLPLDRLKIRFLGRDGPDFSPCARDLPNIEPGQVLLLPLLSNAKGSFEPWQLVDVEGFGLTTRVAQKMGEPQSTATDPRRFIIRELVNSLSRGDPIARFTAAALVTTDSDYLEPDLNNQLQRSIGRDVGRWAQVLGSLLLQSTNHGLTIADVRVDTARADGAHFKALPLARLALSHLPAAKAETQVWQSILADVPGFADPPYHPLFAYDPSLELAASVRYLSRYRDEASLVKRVKAALRADRPGSSAIAGARINENQKACLPEALARAMKVIGRSAANQSDLFSAIMLVLNDGSDQQRRQLSVIANQVQSTNPDYAAFLRFQLAAKPQKVLPERTE